jgi:NAD(P)-dependent dehydrogenase (short-subunit alcohol dehydrogenase family)
MTKEYHMGDLPLDKLAIITSPGRGIGREYALGIAGQEGKVVVADIVAAILGERAKETDRLTF